MRERGAREERRSFQPQSSRAASFISGRIHAEEPLFFSFPSSFFKNKLIYNTFLLNTHHSLYFKAGPVSFCANTIRTFYSVVLAWRDL